MPVKFTLRSPRIPASSFSSDRRFDGRGSNKCKSVKLGTKLEGAGERERAFIEKKLCPRNRRTFATRRRRTASSRCRRGEATFLIPADMFHSLGGFSALNDLRKYAGERDTGEKKIHVLARNLVSLYIFFFFLHRKRERARVKNRTSVDLSNYNFAGSPSANVYVARSCSWSSVAFIRLAIR